MGAYSLGEDSVNQSRIEGLTSDQDPIKAIAQWIPAESLATYIGTYGLIVGAVADAWKPLVAFIMLLIAMAVGLLALLWPHRKNFNAIADSDAKKAAVRSLTVRAVLVSILFVIYVSTIPGNPLELAWGLPLVFGAAAALILNIVIGIVNPGKSPDRPVAADPAAPTSL